MNATKTRDPEMRQTKKGIRWHVDMNAPLGTNQRGGTHSITTSDAATVDIPQFPYLLRRRKTTLHGDKAFFDPDDALPWELSGGRYFVHERSTRTAGWDGINRSRSRPTVRVFAFGTFANLCRVRHRLLPQGT
jgi:IS5 family transposase